MDAILPALLAVLLAETGGKTQGLVHAAGLARPELPVLGVLLLTTLTGLGVAAFGGSAIAHLLTPDARALLAGMALVFAGAPMLLPRRKPIAPPRHLVLALAKSQFGDASQFIVFAIAARADTPVLAVMGGVFGVTAAMLPPLMMGKGWPGKIPLTVLRTAAAMLLLIAGAGLAVGALRLI